MAYIANLNSTHKRTFLLLAILIASWFLLGCEDTCIDRANNGVCIETVSDIGTIGSEIAETIDFSTGNVFAGKTGKGICASAGVNCD